MLYPPHFREIGTVSGWEKLQIHAKEDVSGGGGRDYNSREQVCAPISIPFQIRDISIRDARARKGRAIFPTRGYLEKYLTKIMIN